LGGLRNTTEFLVPVYTSLRTGYELGVPAAWSYWKGLLLRKMFGVEVLCEGFDLKCDIPRDIEKESVPTSRSSAAPIHTAAIHVNL
jgi:hypothetical protein